MWRLSFLIQLQKNHCIVTAQWLDLLNRLIAKKCHITYHVSFSCDMWKQHIHTCIHVNLEHEIQISHLNECHSYGKDCTTNNCSVWSTNRKDKSIHRNKSIWMHTNKCVLEEWGRDSDRKRRREDDERILWMDFSFPSDSRTSFTSAKMATWETGKRQKLNNTEQKNKTQSTLRWSKHPNTHTQ